MVLQQLLEVEVSIELVEQSDATEPTETEALHSSLYIEGLDVEDVIAYFNEVCLDAEFINGGNASLLQKWTTPIYYILNGEPTDEDLEVLSNFTTWLNTIDGFPGIYETEFTPESTMVLTEDLLPST